MGFKVLDGSMKDKKYCNCPCNTFMAPWRNQFKLNEIGLRDQFSSFPACKGTKVTSSELIEHLGCDQVQNFPLHFGVKAYIFTLYKNEEVFVDKNSKFEGCDVIDKKEIMDVKNINDKLMQQPNIMIAKWMIENKNKDFFKMNCNEKISSHMFKGNKAYVQNIPKAFQTK